MKTRQLHFFSGIVLALFIGIHLFNHFFSIFGIQRHIELMDSLRKIYRHPFIEIVLLVAVVVQIISGFQLVRRNRSRNAVFFDKLHLYSGLYLAIFLVIHVSAVLVGRFYLKLDTNFYFGAAGINSFPVNLFFIPYYALAVLSFFGHLAAVHSKKMNQPVLMLSPIQQAWGILLLGAALTLLLFYGLTNQFSGIEIPGEYRILTVQ
jgi:succinate dehydrogenase/fumarate reductase cytochrome b subunit